MENTKIIHTGIGLPTLLAVVFVVLKLCNVIDWSWWTVLLMPFVIQIVIVFTFAVVVLIVAAVLAALEKH